MKLARLVTTLRLRPPRCWRLRLWALRLAAWAIEKVAAASGMEAAGCTIVIELDEDRFAEWFAAKCRFEAAG